MGGEFGNQVEMLRADVADPDQMIRICIPGQPIGGLAICCSHVLP
jgi:hypothetical protein